MTTVFVLTEDGKVIGVYKTKTKAEEQRSYHIQWSIEWYAKNVNPTVTPFVKRNLELTYSVVEMEIQE